MYPQIKKRRKKNRKENAKSIASLHSSISFKNDGNSDIRITVKDFKMQITVAVHYHVHFLTTLVISRDLSFTMATRCDLGTPENLAVLSIRY